MNIQCHNLIVKIRQEIAIGNKIEKTAIIIDAAIPGDMRVIKRQKEKIQKRDSETLEP